MTVIQTVKDQMRSIDILFQPLKTKQLINKSDLKTDWKHQNIFRISFDFSGFLCQCSIFLGSQGKTWTCILLDVDFAVENLYNTKIRLQDALKLDQKL